jgi:dynein heavy chain
MRKANQQKNIYKIINKATGVGEAFKKHKDTLNNIQKALENYLEEKRESFPRFYFLSNDELLEILAKANDMQSINKHIKKCFDNINKLDLGNDLKSVNVEGMISAEGERVLFIKPISTKTEIETWLNLVQDNMIDVL